MSLWCRTLVGFLCGKESPVDGFKGPGVVPVVTANDDNVLSEVPAVEAKVVLDDK